jgi:hypothetical protein
MGRRRSEGRGGCQVQVGTGQKYLLPSGEILQETTGCTDKAKYVCVESSMHYCKFHKRHHGPEDGVSSHHWKRLQKLPLAVEEPEEEIEEEHADESEG